MRSCSLPPRGWIFATCSGMFPVEFESFVNKRQSSDCQACHPDRLVRIMSSQLKHCRIAIPGLPVSRLFGWIACSRLHFSVMWYTSLPMPHVGGISGVRPGSDGNRRVACTLQGYRAGRWNAAPFSPAVYLWVNPAPRRLHLNSHGISSTWQVRNQGAGALLRLRNIRRT